MPTKLFLPTLPLKTALIPCPNWTFLQNPFQLLCPPWRTCLALLLHCLAAELGGALLSTGFGLFIAGGFHTNVGKLCVCRRMHSLFLRKSGIHGLWSRGPSPPAVSRHLHLSFPCLVFRCLPTSFCPLPYSFCFPTTINLRALQNKVLVKPSPPQNHSCSSSLRRDALVEAPSCFPNYLP